MSNYSLKLIALYNLYNYYILQKYSLQAIVSFNEVRSAKANHCQHTGYHFQEKEGERGRERAQLTWKIHKQTSK